MAGKYDKEIKIKVTDGGQLKRTTKDVDKLNKAQKKINKSSQSLDRNMKGNARMSSNASKNFSKQAQGMQGVLVPAYAEVAARVFALTAAFNALSSVANYNILIKGQSEYAKMTGKNMSTIAKSVQVASKHMLDFKEASTSVALASTSGLGTGQIIRMTKAAVDSSAALGRSVTDTMDRLTRGIVKAEPEILDEIGVIIRLDTVYKNYAQSVSKATAELTEGEKATARYNAIIGQLETKFGGIADKLDPNYFQALASTVLDLTNKFGGLVVDGLNPILSWLSKSKGVLALFMALIVKSMVGKMFPIFTNFGEKISSMPAKMGKNIDKLENKLSKLNNKMLKTSKITSTMVKDQASQILQPGQRGAAFDRNPMGSTRATLKQARASMESGVVTYGKLAGKTNKELKKLEKSYTKLNNTIKKGIPLQTRAQLGVLKYQTAVLTAKKGIGVFASSQITAWSTVTKAIDSRGVIGGVSLSVKMLGRAWDKAALSATWYGKAAAGANVAIMGATGAASALGSVLGKAGHVGMAIYGVYQIGKLVVGIFADLDTPFVRAAAASSELADSLKTSLESIDEMDSRLSMDGYASNALESTRNADFAANMGEELYLATSKAMKKLKADISTMSFWDEFADFFMSIVGKGLKDSLNLNISGSLDAMTKLKTDVIAVNNLIDKLHIGKKTKLVQTNKAAQLLAPMLMGISPVLAKYEEVQKTRKELIADLSKSDSILVMGLINDIQKQTSDTAKLLATDIKNLSTQFDKVAKSAKTYKESLLESTPVDEMATAQKEIKKIWESDTLGGADKIFQAQDKGFLKQGSESVKALEAAQATQTKLRDKWVDQAKNSGKDFADSATFKTTQKVITDWAKAIYKETTSYLDVMDEDWLTMQKKALVATTNRITAETKLNLLQKFSKNSSIKEQAKTAKAIAVAKWSEAAAVLKLLKADPAASQEQKNQSAAKLLQLRIAANLAGARELDIQKELNTRRGTTLTLTEEYDAKLKDLKATIVSLSDVEQTAHLKAFATERAAAAEKAYNKIINASNKHFKSLQKIKSIESDIAEIVKNKEGTKEEKDSFKLKLTRLALLHLTKEGKQIKARHKAIDAELENIAIESEHWNKGQTILDYRLRVAQIERDITDDRFKQEKQILAFRELALQKARLEANIVRAEVEKMYSFIRQGFTEANNQFSTSIATAISDALMTIGTDEETELPSGDDIRYFISKTLSDQVGSFVAYQAEQGLLALEKWALKGMGFDDKQIKAMLPQDPIKEMVDELKDVNKELASTGIDVKKSAAYGLTTSTGITEGKKDWRLTGVSTKAIAQITQVTPVAWSKLETRATKEAGKSLGELGKSGSVVPQIKTGQFEFNISTLTTALNDLLRKAGRPETSEEHIKKLLVVTEAQKELFKTWNSRVQISEELYAVALSKTRDFDITPHQDTFDPDPLNQLIAQGMTAAEKAEKATEELQTVISQLVSIPWNSFGQAVQNLSKGYTSGVGFQMAFFTKELSSAMKDGMLSLKNAVGTDGKLTINGFNGKSLEDASNKIGTIITTEGLNVAGFNGKALEDASTKINNAITAEGLKVLGFKGDELAAASNAIVSALKDGNQFRVHVMNFSEMPSSGTAAPTAPAAAPTELDKLKEKYPTIKHWTPDNVPSLNISKAEYIGASSAGEGIGATPIKDMGYLAKEISDGLSASVASIITSVETQVTASQDLLRTLTQSSLITIDATVAAHVGAPLKDAAADIKHFVNILDTKIVPTLDKLDPVLTSLPTLITEITTLAEGVNSYLGLLPPLPTFDPGSDSKVKELADDAKRTADILKKEQGPNSFNVYDAQANKKLDSLKGLRDVWTDDGRSSKWKPGMTNREMRNAQMEGLRQPTNKAWMEAYKGEGKGGGSAGAHKFGPFDTSGKSPYYPSRDFAETRTARDLQKSQVKDLKTKGVHQTIKDLANKMDIERGNFGKSGTDIQQTRGINKLIESKATMVENARANLVKVTQQEQQGFFRKLNAGFKDWWNKGQTSGEGNRKWLGKGGLWSQDVDKLTRTDEGFKSGDKSAKSLRPFKAFTPNMLETGPSPAVRQIFERLGLHLTTLITGIRHLQGPLVLLSSKGLGGGGGDMLSEEQLLLQHLQSLVGINTTMLTKMPEVEQANLANRALSGADDGPQNSLGVNLHNPEDINVGGMATQAVSLARDANGVLKEGFKSVVTGGHFDAKATILGLAQRAAGRAMDSLFDGIFGSFFGSANGNILRGGFQAFAKGGLVTKPTLGLVGEGKYNEAVVPLPDGRSIPISGATGNTENNVTVNVTIDSDGNAKSDTNSGMDGDSAKQLGYMVSQAVQAELVDQKRPGGLLSQY